MSTIEIYKEKIISDIKFVLRLLISSLLYYSGFISLYRYINMRNGNDKGIKILAYHDIGDYSTFLNLQIPEKVFKGHIEYLIKNSYHIISLEEAVNLLKKDEPISKDTVVITFDDCYKSFYKKVFPIIKKYRIPVTFFISTGPLDNGHPLFIDALIYAVENTKKEVLDMSSLGLKKYSIKSKILKEKAIYEINEYSKGLGNKDKKELLESISRQLEIDFNYRELKNRILSWDEVVEMSKNSLVEFGAHSIFHPSLSRVPTHVAENEILNSRKHIQDKLNKEIKTFAYPYGSTRDINEAVRDMIKKNNFLCACTLLMGINNPDDDLFLLKRTCVTNNIHSKVLLPFSKAIFAVQMSDILKKRTNRRQKAKNIKKINILFLIDTLIGFAGTEKHLLNLVRGLDKSKFNCIVCCFEGKEQTMQPFLKQGITVEGLNLNKVYSLKALFVVFRLAKIIKKYSIDIVQTYHFKSDTYGIFVSKLIGVSKIISSRRDVGDLKKPRQIFLNRVMNRFVDRFITVCNKVGKRFNEIENIPYEKMVTLYNGVDINKFNTRNGSNQDDLRNKLCIYEDDFVVGTSAIFRKEKAHHIFFQAVDKTMPYINNLKALVLGHGETKRYFEEYCNQSSLKDIVKFTGYVEDVENYLSLMDVFCYVPNKNEGFSNAILEAMAMGKPVIATDVGGNAEAVVHNETGLIIPPDDSGSLVEAIFKLYRNPELRLEMGRKARRRVEEEFPLEKMIREHERLYEELVNGSSTHK